jgi:hypothetical protein
LVLLGAIKLGYIGGTNETIGLVVGDQLTHSIDFGHLTPSAQIDKGSADSNLTQAGSLASEEKVFVGSTKSNKYHYPGCQWAKKTHPENEIRFSSSQDARAHNMFHAKCAIRLEAFFHKDMSDGNFVPKRT